MLTNKDNYFAINKYLTERGVNLIAVSKTKPVEAIMELYALGQRDFGENYVQELTEKYAILPKDIRWHFIGHLQSNKVKYIAPFVHLIHSVDSEKLLKEIHKEAVKNGREIPCLLQIYIASEETKFGLDAVEIKQMLPKAVVNYSNAKITGLMGMASFTTEENIIQKEFFQIQQLFNQYKVLYPNWHILSTGMSSDYTIAINYGSTMVRIGSLLFGSRTTK